MVKQKKPFILEIKNSKRMKSKQAEPVRSIWGELAGDLKQNLAQENRMPDSLPVQMDCVEQPAPGSATAVDHDDATHSQFLDKWIEKKAERPKTGAQDAVAAFLARIAQQKLLLTEFQSDPDGFKRWRSAWFRKIAGGFGVSVSHDSIDAGNGLRYVVVESADDVLQFLDDLQHHAQTDVEFQRALKENRKHRAARLSGGK